MKIAKGLITVTTDEELEILRSRAAEERKKTKDLESKVLNKYVERYIKNSKRLASKGIKPKYKNSNITPKKVCRKRKK